MRHILSVGLLATLTTLAYAAPTWQTISSEPGKRIELDRTTLKREGNVVQAQGRVVLDKELSDFRTGAGYRVIEAITRYDCGTRNAKTIKRIYKKNETEVIREEELNGNDLPVRSGTLDDKVLREVCRPPKENQAELARKANEAATQLKAANEATLKKELAKTESKGTIKTADHGNPEPASLHSIKPNLKALAEAAAKTQPEAKPAPEVTRVAATSHAAPPARPTPARKPKAPTPRPQEGYMLELTHAEEAVHQHAAIHWDYEGAGGPENWARIDPKNKLCASGERQSPIDIRGGIGVDLEPIRFNYRPSTFRIEDNGHTVQVNVGESSISLTGKTYELVQFHFHRPSEERVNGERFDMVAHLVHKSEEGKLAVVAVLMKRGSENPFIQTLWNNLPLEKNMPVQPPSIAINPADFLPAERPYYTYMGSLTTPPCTEGVLWLVLKQPVQVSDEQIRIFSRLYSHNARPIQPIRDRLIKESR
ncbi:MAG: carbonic anhydrase family protein [Azonexus sp.]|nr:carbonic anhydrase family protein [Azonexus sp.]